MTDYRRYYVDGDCYFFTVNLADKRQDLLVKHIAALPNAFREIEKGDTR